ncbi:mitochondrial PGP phosphatase-domain-containing protein [Obelidium mucronatum]|nr:mitochondrial PGP phosphatase-domain-containing protein [Obelidium mucronatum]
MKGQSYNPKGIRSAFALLTQPALAVPHLAVDNIARIDFRSLKSKGIKAICFDKDNTLTAPYSLETHSPFQESWKECLNEFGHNQVVIVSNSAGSNNDVDFREATEIEKSLKVKVLRHEEKKPGGTQDLLNHFPSLHPSQIAVIGDRLLTDIVYGNKMGAFTILTTKIITLKGDNKFAIPLRKFEIHSLLPFLKFMRISPIDHFLSGKAAEFIKK